VLLPDTFVETDVPATRQLMDRFAEKGRSLIGVQRVERHKVEDYGIVESEQEEGALQRIKRLVEKPSAQSAPSDMAVIGRYVLTPDIFELLETTKPGVGNEIQLTDALNALCIRKDVYACAIEGVWYDVGEPGGYVRAIGDIAERKRSIQAQAEKRRRSD
jgi:UTP--glucose-1-phosphate uridylyltransferase